jgi:thiosulfate/3-mercaptopyruvate sulfurtransferase
MGEQIFVSPEWVASNQDSVQIVDVRDTWEFEGIGHIPNAVNVPFDSFRDSAGKGMLPDPAEWQSLIREAGIDQDTAIVAYDDMHGVFAARFLVTAEILGHSRSQLHLLNGDYSRWNIHHQTTTAVSNTQESSYQLSNQDSSLIVDHETVANAIDDPSVTILDTRDDEEYVAGHIPGAVNIDWRVVIDEKTRGIKHTRDIRSIFADHGISSDTEVVLYCNTARRISHTYLILRELGFTHLGFYEGSLTDWKERNAPIETEI